MLVELVVNTYANSVVRVEGVARLQPKLLGRVAGATSARGS